MALGKLNLKLGIDVSNLEKELGKVERAMSRFGKQMQSIGSTMTQSITLPLLGVGAASLKAFSDMEKLENGLTAIMGSSSAAKEELEKLRKVAENPGLALPQVVQASASLQSTGMSADAARETIVQFGNAVARAGQGAEVFDRVTFALSQVSSATKITQEDLNQLKEALPEFGQVIKNEFGETTAEGLRSLNISNQEFIQRTVEALGKLERAKGGLGNAFDNLKDNVTASLAELGKTINESLKLEEVFIKVSEKIQMLVDKFKALTPEQQENIVKFGLIAAAIGPVILIIGQFATSISAIIGLTRTLIATFTVLTGGLYLVVAAIGALVVYYATTDEGQKSLSKTGKLLSESFDRIKKAFSKTLELLSKLKPLFDFLLLVFGKIAVFTFEVVLSQINAVLKFINFVYDGAVGLLETLKLINKQKVEPKIKIGFGGGSAGKPSGAGGSWGDDTKTTTTVSPEVAALNAKIKALESQLKTQSTTTNNKKAELDKSLFKFDQFKTLTEIAKAKEELDKFVLTEVTPKINEKLGLKEGELTLLSMKNSLNDVLAFGERLKANPLDMATPFSEADAAAIKLEEKMYRLGEATKALTIDLKALIDGTLNDIAVGFGEQLGNALSGAKFEIKALLMPLADAIIQFGKMAIQAGITALAIKKALTLAQAPLAIAAGIALVAIGTAIKNGIATPKLAEGGLAFGPTMATVGDNRNARVDPEVIAPLSKLKSMMGDMGMGGVLETRISGNDLIILLNRSQKTLNRVQ
jgi:tape measure domain-containing protein